MTSSSPQSPTIALVHGAFADSSGWNGVVERLLAAGLRVIAISNPLRGIKEDSAYVRSALTQISGPVLAVGHSYGGAVISNAVTGLDHVIGLVYVSGFAPDEGEVLGELTADSKDSVLNTSLVELHYPGPDGSDAVEFAIDASRFHDAFAADLPAEETAVMAATQRPAAAAAFSEPNGAPAWRGLPAWAVVASGDKAAGSDILRSMAARADAQLTEVAGSHVIMVSQPQVVTDVILEAARSAAGSAPALVG